MKRGLRLVRISGALLCLAALAGAIGAGAFAADETKNAAPPRVADWSLKTTDGNEVRFSEALARGPVLISFWALWCRPCLIELPHMDAIARDTKGRLTVFAINMDTPKSVAKVRPYVKSKGLTLTVPLDTAGEVNRLLQVGNAVPFLILYDREGKEVYRHVGYKEGDERQLRARVDTLLASSRRDSSAAPESAR